MNSRSVFSFLPIALRVPVAAGLIVFLVAIGTTQLAMHLKNREVDRRIEQICLIYFDALVAGVGGALLQEHIETVEERFAEALGEYGIVERGLFAFAPLGSLIAMAGDAELDLDRARLAIEEPFAIDDDSDTAWVSRPMRGESDVILVAALDVSEMQAARTRQLLMIAALDLVIALICGIAAYFVLRRMSRPVSLLTQRMLAAADGVPEPVHPEKLESSDNATAALYDAFNSMVERVRERERLMRVLAQRAQSAALGRLAATLAHEVRNPLAGLKTAVSTLGRYGDDPSTRREALGLLERGIEAIDRTVTGTLNLYRPKDDRRLTVSDLEDLRFLVAPEANRRGVSLLWDIDLPKEVALGAAGVRQVLLNLLLNACSATPRGGAVTLSARLEEGQLICEVGDQGGGLNESAAAKLRGEATGEETHGLGMDVVVSLLGNLEGQASVTSRPGEGTIIKIAIPIYQAEAA